MMNGGYVTHPFNPSNGSDIKREQIYGLCGLMSFEELGKVAELCFELTKATREDRREKAKLARQERAHAM